MSRAILSLGILSMMSAVWCVTAYGWEDAKPSQNYVIVIDSVSRYIFKAQPETALPTRNHKTGKPTITRAFCCEKCAVCDRWKPVPVDAEPEQAPAKFLCPIHKEPMKPTGPIPDNLKFIEDLQQK